MISDYKSLVLSVTISLPAHLQVCRPVRRDTRPASLGETRSQKFSVPFFTTEQVARDDLPGTGSSEVWDWRGLTGRSKTRVERGKVIVVVADAVEITGCMSFAEKELRKDNLRLLRARRTPSPPGAVEHSWVEGLPAKGAWASSQGTPGNLVFRHHLALLSAAVTVGKGNC